MNLDMDIVVCNCLGVTNGMIKEAVEAGANSLEEVQAATSAGTACGGCIENVERLIGQFVKEREQG